MKKLQLSRQPPGHGKHIYAYCNVRTNQVLYSLTQTLNVSTKRPTMSYIYLTSMAQSHQSLKQLPPTGPNTTPPKIRKDLWKPLWTLTLPVPNSNPHLHSQGNPQGLDAFRKLREYKSLHETCWTPTEELSRNHTQEEIDELQEELDNRGGSKKESVFDLIKRKKRKLRLGIVLDQRANSVADLAAVLGEQERVGVEVEEERNREVGRDRVKEVREMVKLHRDAASGGMKRLEGQMGKWRAILEEEREPGYQLKEGEVSKSVARRKVWELEREKEKMEFAAREVGKVNAWEESREFVRNVEEDFPTYLKNMDSKVSGLKRKIAEVESKSQNDKASESLRKDLRRLERQRRLLDARIQAVAEAKEMLEQENTDRELATAQREARAEIRRLKNRIANLHRRMNSNNESGDMSVLQSQLERAQTDKVAAESTLSALQEKRGILPSREENISLIEHLDTDSETLISKLNGEICDVGNRIESGTEREKDVARLRTRLESAEARRAALEIRVAALAEGREILASKDDGPEVLKTRLEEVETRFQELMSLTKAKQLNAELKSEKALLKKQRTVWRALLSTSEESEGGDDSNSLRSDGESMRRFGGRNLVREKIRNWERRLLSQTEGMDGEEREKLRDRVKAFVMVLNVARKPAFVRLREEVGETEADVAVAEATTPVEPTSSSTAIEEVSTPRADYSTHLPSFPTSPTAIDPKKNPYALNKHSALRHKLLRLRKPAFTMQGVTVKWQNILDAEFAEAWPENVVHEPMGFSRHVAPKPQAEAKMDAVGWRVDRQGRGERKEQVEEREDEEGDDGVRRGVVERLTQRMVRRLKSLDPSPDARKRRARNVRKAEERAAAGMEREKEVVAEA